MEGETVRVGSSGYIFVEDSGGDCGVIALFFRRWRYGCARMHPGTEWDDAFFLRFTPHFVERNGYNIIASVTNLTALRREAMNNDSLDGQNRSDKSAAAEAG